MLTGRSENWILENFRCSFIIHDNVTLIADDNDVEFNANESRESTRENLLRKFDNENFLLASRYPI